MPASLPDRLSKRITIAALALAIPLHLYIDPATGWTIRAVAALTFVVAFVCARRWRAITPAVVAAAAPLFPVVLASLVHVAALNVFYTVMLAALFGSLLPGVRNDGWRLPASWPVLLGIWALTLSLAWPVMIAREAGLRLGMLRDTGALDSWAMLTTPQVESWILYVVITQLIAVIWLDWLYANDEPTNPESRFPNPGQGLWIGATIASLIATYQGTINMA